MNERVREWMNGWKKKETKIVLCQQGKRGVLVHPKKLLQSISWQFLETLLKCRSFVIAFLQVHNALLNEISVSDHESMPGFRVSSTAKVAIDKKYLCPLCQLIFKDPVQTDCGHVYCHSCLQKLKRYLWYSLLHADGRWYAEIMTNILTPTQIVVRWSNRHSTFATHTWNIRGKVKWTIS